MHFALLAQGLGRLCSGGTHEELKCTFLLQLKQRLVLRCTRRGGPSSPAASSAAAADACCSCCCGLPKSLAAAAAAAAVTASSTLGDSDCCASAAAAELPPAAVDGAGLMAGSVGLCCGSAGADASLVCCGCETGGCAGAAAAAWRRSRWLWPLMPGAPGCTWSTGCRGAGCCRQTDTCLL